ncbi:MAG: hypothetical protein ACFFAI_08665 [Promethearchaeota archaeon]
MSDDGFDWWKAFLNFLKKNKYKDPIRITGKMLSDLAEKYKWQGAGTENDPIIIDSIDESEEKLDIINSRRFTIFRNCIFQYIKIWNCNYITFEHCGFNWLYVTNCTQIRLIDCTILHLEIYGSEHNYFKKCEIKKIYASDAPNNTFEDLIISSRNFKKFIKAFQENPSS